MRKLDWIWDLSSVDVYKLVLRGRLQRFPAGYWEEDCAALQRANKCTIYLCETILNCKKEDLKDNINTYSFRDHKLGGMLRALFDNNPQKALQNAYPEIFKNEK